MQKLKAERGITLIALIITIIVMLILVGVSVSVALNGGLFATAEQAAIKTQVEGDKEQLFTAAIGAIGIDGKVNYEKLNNNLPQGFTVSNGTYISKEGNNYTVEENGNVKYIETIEELQEKHQFEYYSTLSGAVADVNAETIGTNADTDKKEEAVAGIYVENGLPTVVLLKDTTESAKIEVQKDITINLGGNTLTFTSNVGITGKKNTDTKITIDGRIKDSMLICNALKSGAALQARENNNLTVNGGKYTMNYTGELETATKAYTVNIISGGRAELVNCEIETRVASEYKSGCSIHSISVSNNGNIILNNCRLKTTSSTIADFAQTVGISNKSNAEIINCNIYTDASNEISNKINSVGVLNEGNITIKNSYLFSDSPTFNENYTFQCGAGIYTHTQGVTTISNSYAFGTYSGMIAFQGSKTYVTGGTFESPGYGGIYFDHGTTGEAYIEGAKIASCDYKGRHEEFTAENKAGLYITRTNTTAYLNNCEITNAKGPAFELTSNVTAYISNSTISKDYKSSINNNTNKLYIGRGCNFTADDTNLPEVVTITNEVYTK